MSKQLTKEEARDKLLEYLWLLANYWDSEYRAPTSFDKLSGLVHSILSTLDGESGSLPAWILAPDPHPDDKQFNQDNDEDWWPENLESRPAANIAGALHEHWHEAGRRMGMVDRKEAR